MVWTLALVTMTCPPASLVRLGTLNLEFNPRNPAQVMPEAFNKKFNEVLLTDGRDMLYRS